MVRPFSTSVVVLCCCQIFVLSFFLCRLNYYEQLADANSFSCSLCVTLGNHPSDCGMPVLQVHENEEAIQLGIIPGDVLSYIGHINNPKEFDVR